MRILHMLPDIGIANGIMSAVLNMAKAMPEDIVFDVVYFHETEKTRKDDIEALGGRVYKINKPSLSGLLNSDVKELFNNHKGEWDALHIHAPHFAVFIAPYAKRAGIEKICVHCHSTEYSLKGNSKRNKLLSEYSKAFIDKRFACSEKAGKFWYGDKPFTVINNAIDCKKYEFSEPVRKRVRELFGFTDEKVFCHIGRSDIPQKNHRFLLEIFSEIQKLAPSKLLLIGAEETEELHNLCTEYGISGSVFFLGLRTDVNELLMASDVFLFPSTKEGLPVSLIEAQASSLPVIMSDSITDEAVVTDLVKTVSLNEASRVWAEVCISSINKSKRNGSLINSAWDISAISDVLSDYYRN